MNILENLLGSIITAAALVVDWDATVGGAVVGVSVVESAPEEVVVLVEDVHRGEGVLGEFEIALEQFLLARAFFVLRNEADAVLGLVAPGVLGEFANAGVTVLFSDALLAIFVGLALVVELVLKICS